MSCSIYIPIDRSPHAKCFIEAAESLKAAFHTVNIPCEITFGKPPETSSLISETSPKPRAIILGAHLLTPEIVRKLHEPVIWQLEQLPLSAETWRNQTKTHETYVETLKCAEVWDYSTVNIETLRNLGIPAKRLEVGFSEVLRKIENVSEQAIDVLFVGSLNERRHNILEKLSEAGFKVVHAFDCYGVKRDALIARSKIVLNIHYYESKIWEIVRCSYLLSNKKCVISETGLDDDLEAPYVNAVCFDEYANLVDRCADLLSHPEEREALARRGYEIFSDRGQAEFLKRVLA